MSNVKRYNAALLNPVAPGDTGRAEAGMRSDLNGEYVSFTDYEAALARDFANRQFDRAADRKRNQWLELREKELEAALAATRTDCGDCRKPRYVEQCHCEDHLRICEEQQRAERAEQKVADAQYAALNPLLDITEQAVRAFHAGYKTQASDRPKAFWVKLNELTETAHKEANAVPPEPGECETGTDDRDGDRATAAASGAGVDPVDPPAVPTAREEDKADA